jgi:hypothetical protein
MHAARYHPMFDQLVFVSAINQRDFVFRQPTFQIFVGNFVWKIENDYQTCSKYKSIENGTSNDFYSHFDFQVKND